MKYYAHTAQDKNGAVKDCEFWQPLAEHLENTADIAEANAISGLKACARLVGLLHDIGKYQFSFQERLKGKNIQVDHSVCGAKEVIKAFGKNERLGCIFAYGIIGHHSGLPDKGNKGENSDESALLARLKKETENYSDYRNDIVVEIDNAKNELRNFFTDAGDIDAYEFLIRYLYSCLTDADFLDTERFCIGKRREENFIDWEDCEYKLNEKLSSFKAETVLQRTRKAIQDQAFSNIVENSPIYLLDMPTGSGKTLCSVALALKRIRLTRKKRIIYVIPYTSIIEQTAEILQKLFPRVTILQHHCNFDFDNAIGEGDSDDVCASDKLKKSAENWDVPIIITTNVQFFESIYGNRSSKLRKLHNMAESEIIFDEIHTLPVPYFIPCIKAVEQLTAHYNSEAIFLTATMPDFISLTEKFIGRSLKIRDIIPDKSLYPVFDKCTFEYIGETDVVERIDPRKSTLVICNKKSTAEELYRKFDGLKYHLSTYMTPRDRSVVIAEIRKKLDDGYKPIVFSTSLIEAGVDLDFQCVWREIGGVDNVLQAAGRCNREGQRQKEESKVYIFRYDEPFGEIALKANVTQGLIDKYGASHIASLQCIQEYFNIIYNADKYKMKSTSKSFDIDFKKIADDFKLIDNASIGVVIPCEENAEEISALRAGYANRRKLQKYCASVNINELKTLISAGIVTEYNGIYLLEDVSAYSEETGVNTNPQIGFDIQY